MNICVEWMHNIFICQMRARGLFKLIFLIDSVARDTVELDDDDLSTSNPKWFHIFSLISFFFCSMLPNNNVSHLNN